MENTVAMSLVWVAADLASGYALKRIWTGRRSEKRIESDWDTSVMAL